MSNVLKAISDLQFLLGRFVDEPNDDLTRGAIANTIYNYINSKLSVTDITTVKNIDSGIVKYRITDFQRKIYEISVLP